jgi:hypothetical protein
MVTATLQETNFGSDFKQLCFIASIEYAHNSGFKKLAVHWLNKHLFFVSSAVLADSLVLRNRQLLKPTNRYLQAYDNTSQIPVRLLLNK